MIPNVAIPTARQTRFPDSKTSATSLTMISCPSAASAPPRQKTARDRRPCENCGDAPLHRFDVAPATTLWRCATCGLYQQGSPPTAGVYEQQYHDPYLKSLRRKVFTAHMRLCRIANLVPSIQPSLLDVGCSIGATVTAAKQRGWDAHGADVSQSAIDFCHRLELNCRWYDGGFLPYPNQSFDVVTSWHVIEHVDDVTKTLQDWFRVLRPGGILMLETPHAQCWKARMLGARYAKFWPPEHVYTFTPHTIAPFLQRVGFEVRPTPWIVRARGLGPLTATYALTHQATLAVSRISGFCKAFQTIARRPL